jgi:prevent-host-death family protein
LHGKPVAKIVALREEAGRLEDDPAIGMWADREDMKDVEGEDSNPTIPPLIPLITQPILTPEGPKCILEEVYFAGKNDSMTVTAKQLRLRTSEVLKRVRLGGSVTVTLRGKPVAKVVSLSDEKKKLTDYAAFGMWADREDMRDVHAWLKKIRTPRYLR